MTGDRLSAASDRVVSFSDLMEADRIAADFAEIPFEDHEARKLACAYQHLRGVNRWLRDDIDVKCETIARLEAARA